MEWEEKRLDGIQKNLEYQFRRWSVCCFFCSGCVEESGDI